MGCCLAWTMRTVGTLSCDPGGGAFPSGVLVPVSPPLSLLPNHLSLCGAPLLHSKRWVLLIRDR